MRQVCQLDAAGYFVGLTVADESPLEPGVFLMPARTLYAPVPSIPEGQRAKWVDGWVYDDIPPPEHEFDTEPEPAERTYAEKRLAEYPSLNDYLDGVVKGDQAQIDAYIAACLAVKAKYPKDQA